MASKTHLTISQSVSIPLSELEFDYVRSSGPGGQNVNKVNSQVQLSWDLSLNESLPPEVMDRLRHEERGRISKANILRIDCQQFRDQWKNREACLDRLRMMIEKAATPPRKRKKTHVPRRAKEKRLRLKQNRSDVKQGRKPPSWDS